MTEEQVDHPRDEVDLPSQAASRSPDEEPEMVAYLQTRNRIASQPMEGSDEDATEPQLSQIVSGPREDEPEMVAYLQTQNQIVTSPDLSSGRR
jgi:hypothetical protein